MLRSTNGSTTTTSSSSSSSPVKTGLVGLIVLVLALAVVYRDSCLQSCVGAEGGAISKSSASSACPSYSSDLAAVVKQQQQQVGCPDCAAALAKEKKQKQKKKVTYPLTPPATVLPKEVQRVMIRFANLSAPEWAQHAHDKMYENSRQRFTVITFAGSSSVDLVLNLVASLWAHDLDGFVVFCEDDATLRLMLERGLKAHATKVPPEWKSKTAAGTRLAVQAELLRRGFWLAVAAPDVVFASQHAIQHFAHQIGPLCSERMPSQCFTDLVFMPASAAGGAASGAINAGFYAARSTPLVINLLRAVQRKLEEGTEEEEEDVQVAFNAAVRQLKLEHDKALRALDRLLYANGRAHFELDLSTKLGVAPLVVRCDTGGAGADKERLLKEKQLWFY